MKTERNILTAFILNLAFSCFEFAGGVITGSVAILSDAVHDLGDAASIGLSYVLEKRSKQRPDETHTFGYARYSVLGGALTALILLLGAMMVVYHAVHRIFNPTEINYDGMIFFAVVGVCVNLWAAFVTRRGESLNQKVVNLHMLEDVLGWAAVLLGAVVMRFTGVALLDPLLSIGVAVFIAVHSARHLKEALDLFLEKAPRGINVRALKEHLSDVPGVQDVHHIHVWSMDGHRNCATMHIVANGEPAPVKAAVREELREFGIGHVTLELETEQESCHAKQCCMEAQPCPGHHHHHHH